METLEKWYFVQKGKCMCTWEKEIQWFNGSFKNIFICKPPGRGFWTDGI